MLQEPEHKGCAGKDLLSGTCPSSPAPSSLSENYIFLHILLEFNYANKKQIPFPPPLNQQIIIQVI
jgi:hypothetical protein